MTSETADPQPPDRGSEPSHAQDTVPNRRHEALVYAREDREVFPLYALDDGVCSCSDGVACQSPGPHALTPGGVNDATSDLRKVLDMWTRWPDARIGIPVGSKGDCFVSNPDAPGGFDEYMPTLDALAARYGSPADHDNALFPVETFSTWARQVDAAPDPGWIAEPVWRGDAYGVMAAESKAGKTWAQLDLAVSVATGTPWMGVYRTTRGTVVVFLGEGGERNTVRRIRAILRGRGLNEKDLGDRLRMCFRVPHLTDDEHMREVEHILSEIGQVRLVILDPLYLAAGGANGASLYGMAVPLEAAQHAAQRAGAALMIVHHFNQTGSGYSASRMSGAGPEEWGRVLATVNTTEPTVSDDGRTEVALLHWEFTGSEIVPTRLTVERTISAENLHDLASPLTYDIEPAEAPARQSGTLRAVLDVLADADDWLTTKAIHDEVSPVTGVVKKTVENALTELLGDGQIDRRGKKATGYYYQLAAPPAIGGT